MFNRKGKFINEPASVWHWEKFIKVLASINIFRSTLPSFYALVNRDCNFHLVRCATFNCPSGLQYEDSVIVLIESVKWNLSDLLVNSFEIATVDMQKRNNKQRKVKAGCINNCRFL